MEFPDFYNSSIADEKFSINYDEVAKCASLHKLKYRVKDSKYDKNGIVLALFDYQFGEFKHSGCKESVINLCNFIYGNASRIKDIYLFNYSPPIFNINSRIFWVDNSGRHPDCNSFIKEQDYKSGKWKVTDGVKSNFTTLNLKYVDQYLSSFFEKNGELSIIPQNIISGDVSSSIISLVYEAVYYHSVLRKSQPKIVNYGKNPLGGKRSAFYDFGIDGLTLSDNSYLIGELASYEKLILSGFNDMFLLRNIKDYKNSIGVMEGVCLLKDCSFFLNNNFNFESLKKMGLTLFYGDKDFK